MCVLKFVCWLEKGLSLPSSILETIASRNSTLVSLMVYVYLRFVWLLRASKKADRLSLPSVQIMKMSSMPSLWGLGVVA